MIEDTATAINWKEREQEVKDTVMQRRLELFYEDWQPEDKRQAARFASDLQMLVRSIYAEAGEPYMKQVVKLMESLPFAMQRVGEKS